jgi:hypothetical protein
MSYTKRTCSKCGFRNNQPYMKQIEIEYNSGSSQSSISTGSLIGAWLGDERAKRQNANALFGVSKRKYKRKRKVWVCANGCNNSVQKISPVLPTKPAKTKDSHDENAEINLESTCLAERFFDEVMKVESSQMNEAENRLLIAYTEYLTDETDGWIIKTFKWLGRQIRRLFFIVSLILWFFVLKTMLF